MLFWIDQGVRIFRVDNPHTKPFAFWEWLIAEVRKADTRTSIFLAEAFTRPKVMHRLAKSASPSRTRTSPGGTTRHELDRVLRRSCPRPPGATYFRPNVWPNTPDILPETCSTAGGQAFVARLVLAATCRPSYGIYGPASSCCVDEPAAPGSEEYLDSEKYEIRQLGPR